LKLDDITADIAKVALVVPMAPKADSQVLLGAWPERVVRLIGVAPLAIDRLAVLSRESAFTVNPGPAGHGIRFSDGVLKAPAQYSKSFIRVSTNAFSSALVIVTKCPGMPL
jgi:hypothetical protein